MEGKQSTQVPQHYVRVASIPFTQGLFSFLLLLLDFAPFPSRYSLLEHPSWFQSWLHFSALTPDSQPMSPPCPLRVPGCPPSSLAVEQLPGGWLKAVPATRTGRGRKEGRGANLNKIKARRKVSGRVFGLRQDPSGERGRSNGAGSETELRSWPRST